MWKIRAQPAARNGPRRALEVRKEVLMKRSTLALACAAAGVSGYAAFLRPRFLRWGASPRETNRVWPGDEFMPAPETKATRVVTILAPAGRVWPWVAQIGQDRGGFYSYTPLENMVGAGMKNANKIHREWQKREVGDRVWLGDPTKFDGKAYMVVARWIPGRAMVLVTPEDWERIQAGELAQEMVWAFIVEAVHPHGTRLVARSLGGPGVGVKQKLANYLFWDLAHFIMERGMLLGIKKRAEAMKTVLERFLAFETRAAQRRRRSAFASAPSSRGAHI